MKLGHGISLVHRSLPPGGGVVAPGVLDAYAAGLTGAWSVARLLVTGYTGPLIQVRADRTGQPQMDIGFVPATGLLDIDALLDFAGSDSCYDVIAYSQLGDGNDMVQASASAQPRIVNGGVLDVDLTGRPALKGGGGVSMQSVNQFITYPWTTYSNAQALLNNNFEFIWALVEETRHLGKGFGEIYYANGGIVSALSATGFSQISTYTFASASNEDVLRIDGSDSGVIGGAGSPGGGPYSMKWGDSGPGGVNWNGYLRDLVTYGSGAGLDYSNIEYALTLS